MPSSTWQASIHMTSSSRNLAHVTASAGHIAAKLTQAHANVAMAKGPASPGPKLWARGLGLQEAHDQARQAQKDHLTHEEPCIPFETSRHPVTTE